MSEPVHRSSHAICSYEGTSYRADFWEGRGREYEDLAERIALQHLLPSQGQRLIEVGAGFGRLADLYTGYNQVILLDYAKSGLREAQERLGKTGRFLYVAADLYRLPLAPATCDTLVTVRVLHHLIDVPAALASLTGVLRPGGTYVLEYANKRNIKSMARYVLGRQRWSPYNEEPFEFTRLNFDFHPRWMERTLTRAGLCIEAGRSVSHFRSPAFKRHVSPSTLAALDGLLQVPGAPLKLAPSVFLRCTLTRGHSGSQAEENRGNGALQEERRSGSAALFRCVACGASHWQEAADSLTCRQCGTVWAIDDGIYDFKAPKSKA